MYPVSLRRLEISMARSFSVPSMTGNLLVLPSTLISAVLSINSFQRRRGRKLFNPTIRRNPKPPPHAPCLGFPGRFIVLEDANLLGSLCAMSTRFLTSAIRLSLLLSMFGVAATAGPGPQVLPEGKLPKDARLDPLKDLDGYFPFTPPMSKVEWEKRAERVRLQILISQGLWPMPTKTALNAVIHGKTDRGEYTVEKVYFESAPGFFVTGN